MDTTTVLDLSTCIRMLYKLPPAHTKLLQEILTRRVISVNEIKDAKLAASDKHAYVLISKIRKFLKTKGIVLQNQNTTGYWLEPDARQKLTDELKNFSVAQS